MKLRDHDRPCEHDNGDPIQSFRFGHIVIGTPGGHWCPGGAAVVVDYEAADVALDDAISVVYGASGRHVVDAALGVTT